MLQDQVRAGKIRWLGLSLAADLMLKEDLQQLHAAPKVNVSAVQVVYNRLQKKAEEQVLPFCQAQQLGVLARVPLAKGFLGGDYRPGAASPKRHPLGLRRGIQQPATGAGQKIRREESHPARTWPNGLWPGA